MRADLSRGPVPPSAFRAALLSAPPLERDAWVNAALDVREPPEDTPDLPRGYVPYLPCAVDVIVRAVDAARVCASDVVVDVGSGAGRAAALLHLLTGARVVGVEIQPALVLAARALAARLARREVTFVHGDASEEVAALGAGSVFFLYCPFSGERLARFLDALEPGARAREIRVCAVDLPPLERAWLTPEDASPPGDLVVYRSRLHAP